MRVGQPAAARCHQHPQTHQGSRGSTAQPSGGHCPTLKNPDTAVMGCSECVGGRGQHWALTLSSPHLQCPLTSTMHSVWWKGAPCRERTQEAALALAKLGVSGQVAHPFWPIAPSNRRASDPHSPATLQTPSMRALSPKAHRRTSRRLGAQQSAVASPL